MNDTKDLKQCCVDVGEWHRSLCTRKATVVRDGKSYCKIHDPLYVSPQELKRKAKWDKELCSSCGRHVDQFYNFCPYCGTRKVR